MEFGERAGGISWQGVSNPNSLNFTDAIVIVAPIIETVVPAARVFLLRMLTAKNSRKRHARFPALAISSNGNSGEGATTGTSAVAFMHRPKD
jgi:hypothetical protein